MQVFIRVIRVLGLAMLALLAGAMQFDTEVAPHQVSAPPAVATQALGQLG